MCTAIYYHTNDYYFGRTLDYEHSYGESIAVTPRYYPFSFRKVPPLTRHYALIGVATMADGYPLYYDAANEKGLAMAGLLFSGNAFYPPFADGKDNVAPFELIPWILGQCADIEEAKKLLKRINPIHLPFSENLPLSPLHWMLADRKGNALTIEALTDGLKIYDNPVGVLTNNPPFDYQMTHLSDYLSLSPEPVPNKMGGVALHPYSRGMGAIGLPGDLSSASRFVRAAFVKLYSQSGPGEEESISQFFHILGSVEQQRGCVRLPTGDECTLYTSCCNLNRGIYYYTTYSNCRISAVRLSRENLNAEKPICYPMLTAPQIYYQNGAEK